MEYHDGETIKIPRPKYKTSNKESFEAKTYLPNFIKTIFWLLVMISGFFVGMCLGVGISNFGGF